MWKVLLADDEPFVREGLRELIPWEKLGYILEGWYKNGKELLDHIPELQPDLVILDIRMPIMDGLEAAKRISEEWPEIAVILLTAYSEFQYAKRAIDYQVKSYVMKRNVLEELPEALLKMREYLEQTHENKNEEKDMLRLLLYESEYLDPLEESKKSVYRWFEEQFSSFCLIVIKGHLGEGENREALIEQMEEKIQKTFGDWMIRILAVSVMEYVVLVSMKENKEVELRSVCHNLLDGEGGNLMVTIGRIYEGIDKVSSAYSEVVNYLCTHFLDCNEKELNLVLIDREAHLSREEIVAIISRMIASMEQGDQKKLVRETTDFAAGIRNFSDIQIRRGCLMILTECRRICREFGWKDEEILDVETEEGDARIFRSSSISALVDWLNSCMLSVAEKINSGRKNEEDLVSRVDAFVEKNYTRKLTLDDVADAVYVNRSYLSRIYKQKTGENLFNVINRRKMEEAKRYMSEGKKKIWEIAELVGVEDTAYFSKMFKRYTGHAPREYERTLQDQEEEVWK